MKKDIWEHLLKCIIVAAIVFAAKFAYDSNAKLAVVDSKLTDGLIELKECRMLVSSNTADIVRLQTQMANLR